MVSACSYSAAMSVLLQERWEWLELALAKLETKIWQRSNRCCVSADALG